MIGPEGYLHRWTAPRKKFIQRTRKINGTSKSLVERLVDFKIFALSVLGYLGFISAPDGAILKEEAMRCKALPLAPHNAIPTDLLRAGSACGLGIDLFGIRILSLAARFRTLANSNTLADGLAKISAARQYDGASLFGLTPEWEEKFLQTSMPCCTMEASEYTSHSDHAGRIADSPSDKKQKAATTLLRDAIQKQDFSLPIAARASKIFGPISRHLMAQILPMICNAARASRPGLAVGILCVLCNGMCAAQRIHMAGFSLTLQRAPSASRLRHRCLEVCRSSPSKKPSVS